MARKTSEVESFTNPTTQEFDMGDWDHFVIHCTPSGIGALVVEDSMDGTNWFQVSSTVTAAATPLRVTATQPIASRCRYRFTVGNGGATKTQRRRQ